MTIIRLPRQSPVPTVQSFTTLQILTTWHKNKRQDLILTRRKTGTRFIVKSFDAKTGQMALLLEGGKTKKPFKTRFTERENSLYTAHYE